MKLLVVFFPFIVSSFASPQVKPIVDSSVIYSLEGRIYPQDSFPKNCQNLFQGVKCEEQSYGKASIQSRKENDLVFNKSVFSGQEGDQQIEQSWEKNGRVQKAIIENRVIQKLMQLEVKDGKVYYQVTDLKDNSVKKSIDDAEENLVVPSTIMSYIKPLSDQISKGEKIQIKVAVMERMESFTFNIKKIRDEKTLNGDPVEVLEMSPASLIVRALVSPMYFHINKKTWEMFAYEGESAVRRKVGDSYKKMQVYTSYEYKQNNQLIAGKDDCSNLAPINGKAPMKCEVKQ